MEKFKAEQALNKSIESDALIYQVKEIMRQYNNLKIAAVKDLIPEKEWTTYMTSTADLKDGKPIGSYTHVLKLDDKAFHKQMAKDIQRIIDPTLIKDPQLRRDGMVKWKLKCEYFGGDPRQPRPLFNQIFARINQIKIYAESLGIVVTEEMLQ